MAKKNQRIRSSLLPKGKSNKTVVPNGGQKFNSRSKIVDGIKFRSQLEIYTYKRLMEANLPIAYEAEKFEVLEGFHYPAPSVEMKQDSSKFEDRQHRKVLSITYTPDFICRDSNGKLLWVIECKGFANDRFPNTWKLFKRLLMDTGQVCPLFLPKNQAQVRQCIEAIKNL